MKLLEENDGWRLVFRSGIAQLLKIDFRLGLLITDGAETVDLYVETPFRLVGPNVDTCCVPEESESLAPVLALVNKVISEVTIENSGRMMVVFESGLSLIVDPDAHYEAWQVGGSTGFLLVCRPEKGVTFFKQDLPPGGIE